MEFMIASGYHGEERPEITHFWVNDRWVSVQDWDRVQVELLPTWEDAINVLQNVPFRGDFVMVMPPGKGGHPAKNHHH